MTEKELKRKAKKWVRDNTRIEHSASFGEIEVEPSAELGYIAGATENGIQWHDLRKDPNDLPKEDCEVFAIVKSDGTLYKSIENYYLDKTDTFDGWGTCQKVIAWCEIPRFKE